mgnify:CR=1 FL=1
MTTREALAAARETWPYARLVTAKKLHHCIYANGPTGLCKRAILPGDQYIDPGESNPDSAGGFGGYRYCLIHFGGAR